MSSVVSKAVAKEDLAEAQSRIPPEYVQRRAARIMRQLVGDPKFKIEDEGSTSASGGMATALMSMLAKAQEPKDDSVYEKFEERLVEILLKPWIWGSHDDKRWYAKAVVSLDIDYHPCGPLGQAASDVGLGHGRFPPKTNLFMSKGENSWNYSRRPYVSVSAGYRADTVYHYPVFMKDGQPQGWLVMAITGGDIEKLLQRVETTHDVGETAPVFGAYSIEWVE